MLIHVDTELAAKDLLNSRMAYVSISRGAFDAQLFTNDREKLPTAYSDTNFKAERACTGNHPRANDSAAAGNLQTATGAQNRSRNRFLERLPAPDNGSVARGRKLCQGRPKVAAIAGHAP